MDILDKLNDYINKSNDDLHEEDEFLSDLTESVFLFLEEVDINNLNDNQFEKLSEILEMLDSDSDQLQEVKRKWVVRGGKRIKKIKCKDGYKAINGKCIRMSASEKKVRSKAAKRSAKKKRSKQSSITRKRKRSLKRR